MAEFIILSGKHSGKRLTLSGEEAVIGRDDDCQIRLTSQEISRRHCRIVMTGETIVVTDLGSRNGTFINDIAIQSETLLRPGDVLQVGPMRLQLPKTGRTAGKGTPSQQSAPTDSATSDDEIANWLTDDEGTADSGDSTIITAPREPAAPPPTVEPPKKIFKSVAEEAADIILRHHAKMRDEE